VGRRPRLRGTPHVPHLAGLETRRRTGVLPHINRIRNTVFAKLNKRRGSTAQNQCAPRSPTNDGRSCTQSSLLTPPG
jgi:hypothetical protein